MADIFERMQQVLERVEQDGPPVEGVAELLAELRRGTLMEVQGQASWRCFPHAADAIGAQLAAYPGRLDELKRDEAEEGFVWFSALFTIGYVPLSCTKETVFALTREWMGRFKEWPGLESLDCESVTIPFGEDQDVWITMQGKDAIK